ncbi:MAG TPA: hypothetical protein DCP36_08110 [Sporomusaceae bacterium]|jgi:hypothetical protein|nr:hypothetical protein [Sporomusaceae bacterium]
MCEFVNIIHEMVILAEATAKAVAEAMPKSSKRSAKSLSTRQVTDVTVGPTVNHNYASLISCCSIVFYVDN